MTYAQIDLIMTIFVGVILVTGACAFIGIVITFWLMVGWWIREGWRNMRSKCIDI